MAQQQLPASTARERPTDAAQDSPADAVDGLVEADLLVEDISIDGMCGVY
jgi:mycofactocin precursor